MAEFPSFRLTGSTRDFRTVPMQYQPMNLAPIISSLRRPSPESKSSTPKIPELDMDIEGRIGAVDQYFEMAMRPINDMKALVDMYGPEAAMMPEYAEKMREVEIYTSPQRENIVKRQTADVKRFKEQTKGKGSFYHLGQFVQSGDLKTISDWQDIQERGYTKELGNNGEYVENFDFDPVLYTLEDARKEADALYDKHGYYSVKNGSEIVTDEAVGNMVGAMETYTSYLREVNYGEDADGNGVVEGLDSAHNQAMSRAMNQMLDPTDPLSAGYMQGFLQENQGLNKYKGKKGFMDTKDWEQFKSDYQDYVTSDLNQHFEKRKDTKTASDERKDFQEQNEWHYENGADTEKIDQLLNAVTEQVQTFDADQNIGVESSFIYDENAPNIGDEFDISAYSTGAMTGSIIKDLMLDESMNAFIITEEGGKNYVIPDESFDSQKAFEKAKEFAENIGLADTEKFANQFVNDIESKRQSTTRMVQGGQGTTVTSRENREGITVPVTALSGLGWFYDQADNMVGETADGFVNVPAYAGTTPIKISDLGETFEFDGVSGKVTMVPRVTPSNLGTIYEDGNGNTNIIYHNSPAFRNLPYEKQQELLKGGQTMLINRTAAQNAIQTGNWNQDLRAAGADFTGNPAPLPKSSEEYLAQLVIDSGDNPDQVFFTPGMPSQQMIFKSKGDNIDKSLKSLEKIEVTEEVPLSYSTSERYKEAYNQIFREDDSNSTVGVHKTKLFNDAVVHGKHIKKHTMRYLNLNGQVLAENLGLKGVEAEQFASRWDNEMLEDNVSKTQRRDFIVSAKTKGLDKWNWNSTRVATIKVPAVKNGKFTRAGKRHFKPTYGVDKEGQKELKLRVDGDISGMLIPSTQKTKASNEMEYLNHRLNKMYAQEKAQAIQQQNTENKQTLSNMPFNTK